MGTRPKSKAVEQQAQNQIMADTPPTLTEFNGILTAEYEYIAQTANQAHEDRARVASFYLIAVGSVIAALFGTPFLQEQYSNRSVSILFSVMFGLMTLLGYSTITQLARLRTAWYESMMAMNRLKEFAIQQNASLAEAFRWTNDSLPELYKPKSVSYYQAREVAAIGGVMFGICVFFLQQSLLREGTGITLLHWIITFTAGIAMIFLLLQIYKRMLPNK
jgi:hypothetical protein